MTGDCKQNPYIYVVYARPLFSLLPLFYCLQAKEAEQRRKLKELMTAFVEGDMETPPLLIAAEDGNVEVVAMLLDKVRVDPNFKNNRDETALVLAAEKGHLPVVEALLDAGADTETTSYRRCNALHLAARGGFGGIVDALLKKGANINACGSWFYRTPLIEAAHYGQLNIVKSLLYF